MRAFERLLDEIIEGTVIIKESEIDDAVKLFVSDEKTKTKAELIHRSASKLNRLVNELLDISKIEAGEMKLKACPVNIVALVSELAFSFHSLAERKKIVFNFNNNNNNNGNP